MLINKFSNVYARRLCYDEIFCKYIVDTGMYVVTMLLLKIEDVLIIVKSDEDIKAGNKRNKASFMRKHKQFNLCICSPLLAYILRYLTFRVSESHYNGSGKSFSIFVQSIAFRGFQGQ